LLIENENLSAELCNRQELIQALATDLRRIDSTRRSCMIFELYQRFRTIVSNDLEVRGVLKGGKKLEALLEEVKRGKVFPDDEIVYWMMKFESSSEAQVSEHRGSSRDCQIT